MASVEVVVVGGGIAGASLAYVLASAGMEVTVLEATAAFRDRVRGESMVPWGVREARTLGVERILVEAGAHVAAMWKRYGDDGAEPFDIPVSALVPEVAGTLNLRHPDACQALTEAAAGAGTTIRRGVRDVEVVAGTTPSVRYTAEGRSSELSASLVVGADGRGSSVRRQAGIALDRQAPVDYVAGLLVDGLDDLPADHDVLAQSAGLMMLVFHQGDGRARVYLIAGASGRHRFAGPQGASRFLEACAGAPFPWSAILARGTPSGPCATYPGDDTWTSAPYAEGVVLVGDAAGYNDPIVGQGLASTMRDVRIVRDLVLSGARRPSDFASYGEERNGRMQRLRLMAGVSSVQIEDAGNRPARSALVRQMLGEMDPGLVPLLLGQFSGPETVPDELLGSDILDRIRHA